MANFSVRLLDYARKLFVEPFAESESVKTDDQELILKALAEAKADWQIARSYFESVQEPDLVDYAIYSIEAAERKYMYLLKQAKSKGLASGDLIYSAE